MSFTGYIQRTFCTKNCASLLPVFLKRTSTIDLAAFLKINRIISWKAKEGNLKVTRKFTKGLLPGKVEYRLRSCMHLHSVYMSMHTYACSVVLNLSSLTDSYFAKSSFSCFASDFSLVGGIIFTWLDNTSWVLLW